MSKAKHNCPVCKDTFDTEFGMKIHRGKSHDREYHDKEKLRELYHEKGLSENQIAEHFGASRGSIQRSMDEFDIRRRKSRGDPTRPAHHGFNPRHDRPVGTCEERVSSWVDGKNETVKVHRLIAVAHGKLAPEDMWNADLKVHHKSGHGFDNRPENLEVVTQAEHRKEHAGSPYRTTTE